MADVNERENNDDSESPSIFDLFEPPPEPDPGTFGKVPVVRGDDEDYDKRSGTTAAERKTAAEAEAAGLQHWTAPATGQIPAVLANEDKESDLWGDVKGPSWQSDDPSWSGPDLADVFAGSDETNLGDDPEFAHRDSVESDKPALTLSDSSVADAEPATPAPTPSPSRSEIDDWGSDGLPLPPADTSEGRRIPGTEPPARLETTEISAPGRATDRPSGRTVEAPRPSADREPRVSQDREMRSSSSSADLRQPTTPSSQARTRPTVSLERSADLPVPPALRSRQTPEPTSEQRLARPPGESAGLATEAAPTGHFADSHPTAPGLFEESSSEEQYFDDDAGHDESFLDVERPGGRNLPQAIIAGVILIGLVLAALWVGAEAMMVLVSAVAVLAAIELYNAMRLAGLRPATLLGLLATAALPVSAFLRGDAAFTLVVALLVVFGVLWYLAGADTERPVLNLSLTMLGVFWIGGLGAFAGLILRNDDFGIPLLLTTIGIAVTSDTMAYFGGRAFGRRPFHSVSPNKTWEGTMTGFVFAVFVSFAIAVMPFTTMWDGRFLSALLLGAVVGIMTPLGDLAESLVKRDLGVKDMGTIIPGHGGALDRIDGLLFALPGAYYVALLVGII